jgi:hypothetical protein
VPGAVRVLEHGGCRVRPVADRDGPPADQGGDGGQLGDRVAQHLLDQRLRHLLTGLGVQLAARRRQPEGLREPGDLGAEEPGAEDDVLRVVHRQRRRGAQRVRQPPAAQVLHRPDAGRLGPGTQRVQRAARLDDEDVDAAAAQLERGGQAAGPAADDQHRHGVGHGGHRVSCPELRAQWL